MRCRIVSLKRDDRTEERRDEGKSRVDSRSCPLSKRGPSGVYITITVFLTSALPSLAQFPAHLDDDELNGTNGFVIVGYLAEEFGASVAGIGDVNADGIDDFASGRQGLPYDPHCPDFEPCPQCGS